MLNMEIYNRLRPTGERRDISDEAHNILLDGGIIRLPRYRGICLPKPGPVSVDAYMEIDHYEAVFKADFSGKFVCGIQKVKS